ncbi:MAG: GHMP kinase [Phycisphaeraceae bacterium]|nr:GHMP kinase [Phycisphaeraceae bacterium]
MIISQSPYRVSFAGGGTDLPAFYLQEYGAVLSTAIDKHMYVTVSNRFDASIRVAYSKTEIADEVRDVQHTIVREALKLTRLNRHLEITTIGDVPAGTGMGSSSTLTVGLLHALYGYRGQIVSREKLANEACDIEINRLGKPIGKQDQYAAAFGGINYIRFNPDQSVQVEPVPCTAETLAELNSRFLLLYTNQRRDADTILQKQSDGTKDRMNVLREMRDLADAMRQTLAGDGDIDEFASLLHEGWLLKRSLGFGISNDMVDQWYDAARRAGAQGGKLLGAGGGGFVLLLAPPERHEAIREAMGCPRQLPIAVDQLGSRIIFISQRHAAVTPAPVAEAAMV